MLKPETIQKLIDELLADERIHYPPANVFSNAPLALMQVGMKAKLHAYQTVLGVPLSTSKDLLEK